MSPGSLLLDNCEQSFECGHAHGTGDRCVSLRYSPEFFDRAGGTGAFPVHRIPPIAALAPWVAEAKLGIHAPGKVVFEELAYGLAGAVLGVLGNGRRANAAPSASDERRISTIVRFIEANSGEPLTLEHLARRSHMSEFHFLRVFKQVTGVTPHQFILRSRLREAALRLKTGRDTVLGIALDAGFRDLSNFNQAFRGEFGVNPARFRAGG
jgi:AraC-like DNA-binding protein